MTDTLASAIARDSRAADHARPAAAWSRLEDHARWTMLEDQHTTTTTTTTRPPAATFRGRWSDGTDLVHRAWFALVDAADRLTSR